MSGQVVNLAKKFAQIRAHWHPHLAGQLNGQQVRLVKLLGEFTWHHHDHEDELFLVINGASTVNTGNVVEARTRGVLPDV